MAGDADILGEKAEALAQPFHPDEVKFKPAAVSGGRALALAYVDARVIQDRLDDVMGTAGWQDEYEFLDDGSVVCRLRLRFGAEWITKTDVGGPSEQPDEGDRRKAAVSDALKRAAVKFGIGRYLYRLPQQWVDYDAQKKQIKTRPQLPEWAIPRPREAPPTSAPAAPKQEAAAPAKKPPARKEPKTGGELVAWLADIETKNPGLFARNQLRDYIHRQMIGAHKDTPMVMGNWGEALVKVAVGMAYDIGRKRREEVEAIASVKDAIGKLLGDVGLTWDGVPQAHKGDGPEANWSLAEWQESYRAAQEFSKEYMP